jgi:thioredoxin 1
MASEKVLVLDDSNFTSTVATGVTLVDFWAPWCGPCRMIAPLIDKVAERVQGKAKVAKINTDEGQDSAMQYGVQSIPTLIIFKDGKEVERLVGASQRENDLVDKLMKHA